MTHIYNFVNRNQSEYIVFMLNIYEVVRILLWRKGLSVRKAAAKLIELGYDFPAQGGLSNKFNKKTVRFEEVQILLDFLGYELVIREKK